MGEIINEETPFDRVQFLLEQWNLIELLPDFKDKGIDVEVLQELTKEDIDNLIPAEQFGLRIKFRKKLISWQQRNERQQEFNTVLSTADAARYWEPRAPSVNEITINTQGRQNINNTSSSISEQINTREHYVYKGKITNKNIENNTYEYKQQSSIEVFADAIEELHEDIVRPTLGRAVHNSLQNGKNFLKYLDETVVEQGKIIGELVEETVPEHLHNLAEFVEEQSKNVVEIGDAVCDEMEKQGNNIVRFCSQLWE